MLPQLSRETNDRIKIHRTPDTYTEPGNQGALKFPKHLLLQKFKFASRLPQKSSSLLRSRRN